MVFLQYRSRYCNTARDEVPRVYGVQTSDKPDTNFLFTFIHPVLSILE
jgi:hypothetical protein